MRAERVIVIVVACLVVTVAAIAYAAGKATSDVPEVIRAQRFEVVDAEGKVRAVLALDRVLLWTGPSRPPDGALLALYDDQGKRRAEISLFPSGQPRLMLSDAQGKMRAELALSEFLAVLDDQDKLRAEAALSRLTLRDGQGKTRAKLAVSPGGRPNLRLSDENGKAVWQAP